MSTLVIERSALVPTAICELALLFVAFGSPVVVATVAVSVMTVPMAVLVFTFTVTTNVPVAPLARVAMVHVMVPVAPTAGVTQTHPAGVGYETKVVFVGTTSVNETVVAAPGPPLVATCVYVMLLPAVAGSGTPTLLTLMSACPAFPTAMLTVAELFPATVSRVVVVTVTVSEMIVPAAVPGMTLTTTWKFVVVAGASVAIVQVMFPAAPIGGNTHAHPAGVVPEMNVELLGIA